MANETPANTTPSPTLETVSKPAGASNPTAKAASSAAAKAASSSAAPLAASAPAQKPAAALQAKKALSGLKKLGIWAQFGELLLDLFSTDSRTRRVARYFLLSVLGVVAVLIASGVHFKNLRGQVTSQLASTGEQGKNLGDFIAKQAEEAKQKFSVQPLGMFTIEIKSADGQTKLPPGVMNLANVQMVVECDSKTTCDFVEERMPQIRNLVTDVLLPMDREELLSREGKRRLKKRIMDKLNSWLPTGTIRDLYFDKLIVS